MSDYIVYKHTSPRGKAYIGITNDYERRCKQHKSAAKNGVGCRAFGNAIKKYGWNKLKHEILMAGLTAEQAKIEEVRLIAEHDTMAPNGYNLTEGGEHGTHSEETRRRIGDAHRGKTISAEHKAAISTHVKSRPQEEKEASGLRLGKSNVGKPKSPEHIEAVRSALWGDTEKAATTGKKISTSKKGKSINNTPGLKDWWANRTPEEIEAATKKRLSKLDPAKQAEKVKAAHAAMTTEQKAQRAANIKASLAHRVKTPEQKEEARMRRNERQRLRRAAKVLS